MGPNLETEKKQTKDYPPTYFVTHLFALFLGVYASNIQNFNKKPSLYDLDMSSDNKHWLLSVYTGVTLPPIII